MSEKLSTLVNSEIGNLEAVILHRPGPEVENMTPENAERALYSDILNLPVALKEYNQLHKILDNVCKVFFVQDLLEEILDNEKVREQLIFQICENENIADLDDELYSMEPKELSKKLIEGVVLERNTMTKFMSNERYSLKPLHNFFFTRDASITVNKKIVIGKMNGQVRDRESIIMDYIFTYSPRIDTRTINPVKYDDFNANINIEGGDLLIAREDILLVGMGPRTTSHGIDFLVERFKEKAGKRHIIVQELPKTPESFIHLDMVFTLLDRDKCMIYAPVILCDSRFTTAHITIDHGKVKSIVHEENILSALKKLGMDLKPIFCGGSDPWIQQREQWHSGANFFSIAPGKIIGYERNIYTMHELSNNGFEIIKASDFKKDSINLSDDRKILFTIDGSELARGGGGCRCMTMPIRRTDIEI
ncbi:MAG: arginine deiminase family protein [Candidatus Muirbacterium halophilum]|nr:arginine deiminase family protein [Candidatus Muirbacterium halophilum]MCK9476590.1 arginine deiminase family protein [Candidatus Muirbacterium halophilum]